MMAVENVGVSRQIKRSARLHAGGGQHPVCGVLHPRTLRTALEQPRRPVLLTIRLAITTTHRASRRLRRPALTILLFKPTLHSLF